MSALDEGLEGVRRSEADGETDRKTDEKTYDYAEADDGTLLRSRSFRLAVEDGSSADPRASVPPLSFPVLDVVFARRPMARFQSA